VPQDAPLFHDTVRANLLIARREARDDALWSCLERAGAGDLVRQLPQGLDTVVGDGGVRLSGGERQRLRLASALVYEPDLLILDEATSALNPRDEEAITATLKGLVGQLTLVIISHRALRIEARQILPPAAV
jgi:ABC-type multidrug transport system fused ATPase/permease subunit